MSVLLKITSIQEICIFSNEAPTGNQSTENWLDKASVFAKYIFLRIKNWQNKIFQV